MPRDAEQGFVLIAALWLLLLAGSIAALLMLRGLDAARDVRETRDALANQWSGDDAVAAVTADILFAGQASRWGRAPAGGSIEIGGRAISADLAIEDGLDVNRADLAQIDDALHDHGFAPEQRPMILGRIAAERSAARSLSSIAAVAALASGILPAGRETCLARILSPFGATTAASLLVEQRPVRLGDVLRLRLQDGRTILFRIVGGDEPVAILDSFRDRCGSGPAAGAA